MAFVPIRATRMEAIYKDAQANTDCPVCLKMFLNPQFLRCGHTFCQACLATLNEYSRMASVVVCPLCREPCELSDIKTDVSKNGELLIRLELELLRLGSPDCDQCEKCRAAKMLCAECGALTCEECGCEHETEMLSTAELLLVAQTSKFCEEFVAQYGVGALREVTADTVVSGEDTNIEVTSKFCGELVARYGVGALQDVTADTVVSGEDASNEVKPLPKGLSELAVEYVKYHDTPKRGLATVLSNILLKACDDKETYSQQYLKILNLHSEQEAEILDTDISSDNPEMETTENPLERIESSSDFVVDVRELQTAERNKVRSVNLTQSSLDEVEKMVVIDGELWCLTVKDLFVITPTNGQVSKTRSEWSGDAHSLAYTHTCDVAIATTLGLWVVSFGKRWTQQIASGSFMEVLAMGQKLYAVSLHEKKRFFGSDKSCTLQIHQLRYTRRRWKPEVKHRVVLPVSFTDAGWLSCCIHSNGIYALSDRGTMFCLAGLDRPVLQAVLTVCPHVPRPRLVSSRCLDGNSSHTSQQWIFASGQELRTFYLEHQQVQPASHTQALPGVMAPLRAACLDGKNFWIVSGTVPTLYIIAYS